MMKRTLSTLDQSEFDLLVVGGGIFGACAAWDATQRGLSVAIIDRGDFCSATSANSFKLLHGGIRYLQHGDLYRVRQSANARCAMIRVAPHLAQPLPTVVPTYGHGMKGKGVLRAAMAIYDLITLDRNRGILDPSRRIPRGICLSRHEVIERYPGIKTQGLTGAAVFCEGQMYNPPRLVLAFLHSAAEAGAIVSNYVEATNFIHKEGRVCGVKARDVLSGNKLTIRAKLVLNAAGPYAEGLLDRALGQSLKPGTPWSRDAYFVVARPLVEGKCALALQSMTKDPEAIVSRGERHLFLVPWRGYTLVGVWHQVYQGHPDQYNVTDEELEAFIGEINSVYPSLDLTLDDVALWNAGLIPFGENDPNTTNLKFAHRSRLVDHKKERALDGIVTLIGVRYTTGQCESVRAIDLIFRKLGKKAPPSRSHMTPIYGGRIENFEALVQQASAEFPTAISANTIRALIHNHGAMYHRVLNNIKAEPDLGQTIGSSTILKAEVVHAVREEMAQTLGDIVFRRTDLGTGEYPGRDEIRICAELMSSELGWDQSRIQQEIEKVVTSYPPKIRSRRDSLPN